MYDYGVFIGRFQPPHKGHISVVKQALKSVNKLIIVLGSHFKALDTRNPFSTQQRIDLFNLSLSEAEKERIIFVPVEDYTYNDDLWIAAVQTGVWTAICNEKWSPDGKTITLVGYEKDHTSYYLKKFPDWDRSLTLVKDSSVLNSTDFRQAIFEDDYNEIELYTCSYPQFNYIENWMKTSAAYENLAKEYNFIKQYKQQWENSPYPPTFVTVDAIVRQSGKLLLVKRKAEPGKGLLALPGGFVNQKETLEEAVIRELYEETRIAVPKPVLKGSRITSRTFDDPHRSARGRTITEVFDFKLNDSFDLPKVKGGDDADKAFWMTYADVVKNRDQFFEDHFQIIRCMIGL